MTTTNGMTVRPRRVSSHMAKTTQIQLRLTDDQKSRLQTAARDAGAPNLTEYILSRCLPGDTKPARKVTHTPHVRIGGRWLPVADVLKGDVAMRPEEK